MICLFFRFLRHCMFRSMCYLQLRVTYAVDFSSLFSVCLCNRFYTGKLTYGIVIYCGQSQWLRGVRCGSAVVRLLGLRVRIPPVSSVSACCRCCLLSEFSTLGWSLIQRSSAECGVSLWSWSPDSEEAVAHDELVRHRKKIHCELGLLVLISVAKIRLLETLNDCMHIIEGKFVAIYLQSLIHLVTLYDSHASGSWPVIFLFNLLQSVRSTSAEAPTWNRSDTSAIYCSDPKFVS